MSPPLIGPRAESVPADKVKRILIVGMSGYLGAALAIGLRDEYEIYGTYFEHPIRIDGVTALKMNCLNGGEILNVLQKVNPDVTLFCIGLNNVEQCQSNMQMAESLNVKAAALFFKVIPANQPFIYFSADQVFNSPISEENSPFTEKDKPNSTNSYGLTKVQGEAMVMAHKRLTHVIRLSNLFGEPMGSARHVRRTWVDWLSTEMRRGGVVQIYQDQMRSHLYIGDVIRGIRAFLKGIPLESALYHFAGADGLSKVAFARIFAELMEFKKVNIQPISAITDLNYYKAPRSAYAVLSAEKFEQDYNFKFQNAKNGLIEYVERMRSGSLENWF